MSSILIPRLDGASIEQNQNRLRELLNIAPGADIVLPENFDAMSAANAIEVLMLMGGVSQAEAQEQLDALRSENIDDCIEV